MCLLGIYLWNDLVAITLKMLKMDFIKKNGYSGCMYQHLVYTLFGFTNPRKQSSLFLIYLKVGRFKINFFFKKSYIFLI